MNKNMVKEQNIICIKLVRNILFFFFFVEEVHHDNHQVNGAESPNVELFDRTGELLDNENINWQSSAVYDQQDINSIDNHVWSVVNDLTRKTHDLLYDEAQVSSINN